MLDEMFNYPLEQVENLMNDFQKLKEKQMKLFKKTEVVEETEIQKELRQLREYVNILDSNHILGLMTDKEYQYELMLIDNSVSELERVLL